MSKPSFESTLSHAAAHGGLRGIAQQAKVKERGDESKKEQA